MKNENVEIVPEIRSKVYVIRGMRVMLDADLAELYGVEVKRLNEQVRRNLERFPSDFMFQLTEIEAKIPRSQIATLNDASRGSNIKYLPLAFTQEGIAMLSGILRSETAVRVNIEIMRTFVRMKNTESESQALWSKIDQLEKKYDANFAGVFEAIRQLMGEDSDRLHRPIKPLSE